MIPRIKTLAVLDDFRLAVEFDDGYKVIYDVKKDIETMNQRDRFLWPNIHHRQGY